MHKRVVTAVAALLFTLLAFLVSIMSDLHDRNYPVGLHAASNISLDFARSGLGDEEAFTLLGQLSDRWDLGLVKITPDLAGAKDGQVFAAVGHSHGLPAQFGWWGSEPAGKVVGRGALTHSFATGAYLVTASSDHLNDLQSTLAGKGVVVRREDDSAGQTANFFLRQGSFRAVVLASVALLTALALYWLAVRSSSRALRVLAGVSTLRIQRQDLGQYLGCLAAAAVPVAGLACGYVAVSKGTNFLGYYARTLFGLDAIVLGITLTAATIMMAAAWPSITMLAHRRPASMRLLRASAVLKGLTLLLLLLAVGPAWSAYRDASATAAQQSQWRHLSDEVALRYPGALGEEGFKKLRTAVGQVVQAAEIKQNAALSYTISADQSHGIDQSHSADFGTYSAVSVVDRNWLALMLGENFAQHLQPVTLAEIPSGVLSYLRPNLPIWSRAQASADQLLARFTFYRPAAGASVPVAAGGNGDLSFPDNVLLMVAPDLYATFNDDFLASASSSNNLVFASLNHTLALLDRHGLQHNVQVRYIAEDGILRAQFATYMVWLRTIALLALAAGCALAAAVSAFILALTNARRDFPLRLAGCTWPQVLRSRLVRDTATGGIIALVVLLAQPPGNQTPVIVASAAALALAPCAHLIAARWCFAKVSLRTL